MRVLKTCLIIKYLTQGDWYRKHVLWRQQALHRWEINSLTIVGPRVHNNGRLPVLLGLTSKGRIYSKHQDPKHSGPHTKKNKAWQCADIHAPQHLEQDNCWTISLLPMFSLILYPRIEFILQAIYSSTRHQALTPAIYKSTRWEEKSPASKEVMPRVHTASESYGDSNNKKSPWSLWRPLGTFRFDHKSHHIVMWWYLV